MTGGACRRGIPRPDITLVANVPINERGDMWFAVDALSDAALEVDAIEMSLRGDAVVPESMRRFLDSGKLSRVSFLRACKRVLSRPPAYYIDYLDNSFRSSVFRHVASRAGARRITLTQTRIPIVPDSGTRTSRSAKAVQTIRDPQRALVVAWRLAMTRVTRLDPAPEVTLLGCRASGAIRDDPVQRARNVVIGHAFDMDRFLREVNSPGSDALRETPYAVFIDEDLPAHPDYAKSSLAVPVSEADYYPALLRFLRNFKRVTGLEVVVALHPRSVDSRRSALFEEFATFAGQTTALVRNARLVLMHCSTSRSFAILSGVPVVCLTSEGLERTWVGDFIEAAASSLGAPLIRYDRDVVDEHTANTWYSIDTDRYEEYARQYLVAYDANPTRGSWEILRNALQQEGLACRCSDERAASLPS